MAKKNSSCFMLIMYTNLPSFSIFIQIFNCCVNLAYTCRCQGYIKARMKSEEKRRTRFHSGHGGCVCVCVSVFNMGFHTGKMSAATFVVIPRTLVLQEVIQSVVTVCLGATILMHYAFFILS